VFGEDDQPVLRVQVGPARREQQGGASAPT